MSTCKNKLLSKLLQNAIRESWNLATTQHPKEDIYAYILYTSPLLGYVVPSFNSMQALDRIAGDEAEREYLRWSPSEWEYHLENKALFDKVQEVLSELNTESYYDDEQAFEHRWQVFVSSLVELDREGIFGVGKYRNQLTLNIMCGDLRRRRRRRSRCSD